MADVVEINDLQQLQQFRMAWTALQPQTPRASFFHSFDWLETYWKHFGRQQRLRVLVVRSSGSPVGMVPLCVRRRRHHLGSIRVLTYPGGDWGVSCGPIGPDQTASMVMAWKHVRERNRDWDMIDLRCSPAELRGGHATGVALRAAGFRPQKSAYQVGSIVRFAGTDYEGYLANRGEQWHHEMGRQARALAGAGTVSLDRHRPAGIAYGDDEPRWDLYQECLDLSRQRVWQPWGRSASSGGNSSCHRRGGQFQRDCHAAAARLGMLDFAVLRLAGTPVAFQYNFHFDGTVVGLGRGSSPALAKVGADKMAEKILVSRLVEEGFRRGDRVWDLGGSQGDVPHSFRTDVETSYVLACFPWSAWRSQGVRLSRWFKECRGSREQFPAGEAVSA